MRYSSNQDAFGWILLILSCLAFVACGAREENRVDATRVQMSATDSCSPKTASPKATSTQASPSQATFDERFVPRLEDAFAPLSEISEFLRLSVRRSANYGASRRARLCEFVARAFQTSTNRLVFERDDARFRRPRSFWTESSLSNPLFITFLTLRN